MLGFRSKKFLPSSPSLSSPPSLTKPKLCCSARLAISFTCFFCLFNVSFFRVMISIGLVCMSSIPRNEIKEDKIFPKDYKTNEFEWTPSLLGHLTSAAFYGFILGPFLGGFLSFKYGGKIIMLISQIALGVLTLLVPEGTRIHPSLLFLLRIVAGFFASFSFPAYYDLVAHWIVTDERQFLVSSTLVSIPLANILNFPINSVFCVYLGWVWIFYIFGIWVCIFTIFLSFLIYNYPHQCRFISNTELMYLESNIPKDVKRKIPWLKIISSMSIYAFVVIHFSVTYVYLNMIFSLPFLLEEIYGVSLREVGFLSALPFVGSLVMRILLSFFFEKVRRKLKLSKNMMRKSCIFIGCCLVSVNYLVIIILPTTNHKFWVLGCFILASTCLELVIIGGYLLSLLDICPSFVNLMTGVTNTLGNSAGLIGPVLTGILTPHGNKEEWNYVFYLNIVILNCAMLFYLVFGRNRLEPWGMVRESEDQPADYRAASRESIQMHM